MDDAEKQFYNDPAFELDLHVMRFKAHLEFAKEKLDELKLASENIAEQIKKIANGDDNDS